MRLAALCDAVLVLERVALGLLLAGVVLFLLTIV